MRHIYLMSVVQSNHISPFTNQIVSKIPNNNKKNNSINVAKFYSYEMDFSCSKKKKKCHYLAQFGSHLVK